MPDITPRIVAAVGIAVRSSDTDRATQIESAMAEAVRQAIDDGVALDDTDEMRARMTAARALIHGD